MDGPRMGRAQQVVWAGSHLSHSLCHSRVEQSRAAHPNTLANGQQHLSRGDGSHALPPFVERRDAGAHRLCGLIHTAFSELSAPTSRRICFPCLPAAGARQLPHAAAAVHGAFLLSFHAHTAALAHPAHLHGQPAGPGATLLVLCRLCHLEGTTRHGLPFPLRFREHGSA